MLFLVNLLFCILDIFHNCKVMIFCHVNHVVDIFDFLVHIDWHRGDYFFHITCSLLVMLFHLCVFIEYRFWDWLEFEKFRLYLIFLMFKLLIFFFKMFNEWHEILHFEVKAHVGVVLSLFFRIRNLWEGSFASLWDSILTLIFIEWWCH